MTNEAEGLAVEGPSDDPVADALKEVVGRFRNWQPTPAMRGFARAVASTALRAQAEQVRVLEERQHHFKDEDWPLALQRLKHTEPGPDQGCAIVGVDDLEFALERLAHFASVAMGNAAEIGRLTARAEAAERRAGELEGERDEYGEIGERDGYERAVQDIDLLTGGDGEYRVSTQAARSCPDVATMKTRIAARFAEGQSAIERLMEQKRTTKALGCPHYGDLALRCAAAEARAEAAERRAGELEGALRKVEKTLQVPAAEYVPAIPDAWEIIDKALKSGGGQ